MQNRMEQTAYPPNNNYGATDFGYRSVQNEGRKSNLGQNTQQRDTSNNRKKIFEPSRNSQHNLSIHSNSQVNIPLDTSGRVQTIQDKSYQEYRYENPHNRQPSNNTFQRPVTPKGSTIPNQNQYATNQQYQVQSQKPSVQPQQQQNQQAAFNQNLTPKQSYSQNVTTYQKESYKPQAGAGAYEKRTTQNDYEHLLEYDEQVKRTTKRQTVTTHEVEKHEYVQSGVSVKQIQQPIIPVSTEYQNQLKSDMDIYLFNYHNQDGEQNYAGEIQRLKNESQNVSACNIF